MSECKHLNSYIRGKDTWGMCYCPDCDDTFWFTVFMRNILDEIIAIYKEIKKERGE